jgi:hypothetical protein
LWKIISGCGSRSSGLFRVGFGDPELADETLDSRHLGKNQNGLFSAITRSMYSQQSLFFVLTIFPLRIQSQKPGKTHS